MFDATAGRNATIKKIELDTNRFAAEVEDRMSDLSLSEQEALVKKLLEVVSSVDSARNFTVGQTARRALGTGQYTDAQEGLQAILNDSSVDLGTKQALRRLLTLADHDHIAVSSDGTPSELIATRHERDAAQRELENERDATHNGSLAKQLATVVAERDAARAAAGSFNETAAQSTLTKVDEAIDSLSGRLGGRVDGIVELKRELNALLREVHLSRA